MQVNDQGPCPYCSNVPGVGPNPQDSDAGSRFDVAISSGSTVVLTPTIGMLMPGYLLAVTRTHLLSFAQLEASELERVESWLEELLGGLGDAFGEYLVFEHGSGALRAGARSGACVVHAHLHLIPGQSHLISELVTELGATRIQSLPSVVQHAADSYVLMGRPGLWFAHANVDLVGQWIRRRVALEVGRADEFDWALFRGEEHLPETFQRMPRLLPPAP